MSPFGAPLAQIVAAADCDAVASVGVTAANGATEVGCEVADAGGVDGLLREVVQLAVEVHVTTVKTIATAAGRMASILSPSEQHRYCRQSRRSTTAQPSQHCDTAKQKSDTAHYGGEDDQTMAAVAKE